MLLADVTLIEILEEVCGILVAGVSTIGSGIATGVKNFVTELIYDGTAGSRTMSSFIGIVAVFGGIALAVGLTTLVFNWVKNLGA